MSAYIPTEPFVPSVRVEETITRYLRGKSWHFGPGAMSDSIQFSMRGKNGRWNCIIRWRDERQVVLLSILSVVVPVDQRREVSELLTRINYGLTLGNFEMDLSDGQVQYRTSVDTGGRPLSDEALDPIFWANFCTTDRYLPAINQVLFGETSPETAVALVELAA
jgi:hypothetical protein